MLRTFGHRVAMCCNMLGVVGSSLKLVKFEPITLNMSQHVATRWPNARNILRPAMLRYVVLACCDCLAGALKFEPTIPNMSQHIATAAPNNVAVCLCVKMLRTFGRGFNVIIYTLNYKLAKNIWTLWDLNAGAAATVENRGFFLFFSFAMS